MKRTKRIAILAGVLASACVATFAVTKYEKKQEEIKNTAAIIMEIPPSSVTSLSWESENSSLSFRKEDGIWKYNGDDAFPVDNEKISEILSHFESLRANFMIENVEDFGQYGLQNPETIIHISTADKDYELKLGDFSKMDEQRYVNAADGNVYLVDDDPLDALSSSLSDVILHDTLPYVEELTKLKLDGAESLTVSYEENSTASYAAEDKYFAKIDGKTVPLDSDSIDEYLNTINSLILNDYATYNASEEELKAYGLDTPELSITIDYQIDGTADSFTLHIGQNQDELKEAAKSSDDTTDSESVTKYLRVGDSPIIYILDDASYEVFAESTYKDLRHDELIWADMDQITGMDVTLEGETHSLTSKKNGDSRIWYYGDEEIDFSDIYRKLEAIEADTFTSDEPSQKEEIRLIVYLDNENFPQIEMELYRHSGTLCLAKVNGETISLVERTAVVDLMEEIQKVVIGDGSD